MNFAGNKDIFSEVILSSRGRGAFDGLFKLDSIAQVSTYGVSDSRKGANRGMFPTDFGFRLTHVGISPYICWGFVISFCHYQLEDWGVEE